MDQLEEEIGIWTEGWNEDPRPFIWKKPADEIIAKVKRGRSTHWLQSNQRRTTSYHLDEDSDIPCRMVDIPPT